MTDKMIWIREPEEYKVQPDRVEITTMPHTDLWQRTYYGFQNDNAPVFCLETDEKFFSFTVKTDFSECCKLYDQCGIALYQDQDNWLKASVEFEDGDSNHLGSVVTNNGYSDWAMMDLPKDVKVMWYRLSRRESDYLIEWSRDGITFTSMRICHIFKGEGRINFGIYACSPGESSFKAVFTDMKLTECVWEL